MNEQTPPVKAGETYEVEIQSVGEKGDGIARVKGFVLFVPGVKKGDFVKIKVTKVLPKVGFAEVLGQLEKIEQAPREQKFATVSRDEMEEQEQEEKFEETDDFGEDLDK
ncbi:TRAM domain-containing protein [Candidatus Woesearchaeota archaeon]|nr:TRAM domain-containing protein [Candidatus Woesearchaeota archaeon]